MASLGSSNVSDSQLWVRLIEGDDEVNEATMDLVRAHVRLILVRALTMEESKPALLSAFSALGRFGLDNRVGWLMSLGSRLESMLARRERVMSRRPVVEAAHRITQERLAGERPGWSDVRWGYREARLLDHLTRKRQATLADIEEEIWGLIGLV